MQDNGVGVKIAQSLSAGKPADPGTFIHSQWEGSIFRECGWALRGSGCLFRSIRSCFVIEDVLLFGHRRL